MIQIEDILTIHNVKSKAHCDSKKSVLDLISKLSVSHVKALEKRNVLRTLSDREKLGSTALGHGVALPHGRIKGIEKPICVLVSLESPIEFDAADEEPVDLFFGLLIPEQAIEDHLTILAMLAERLSDSNYREKLRSADNSNDLLKYATEKK